MKVLGEASIIARKPLEIVTSSIMMLLLAVMLNAYCELAFAIVPPLTVTFVHVTNERQFASLGPI
jgi:hypothetical protein